MSHANTPGLYFGKLPKQKALSECRGLLIALVIMGSWLCHLGLLLPVELSMVVHPAAVLGAILIQTFLNTGLFITAHDAIHGLVYPGNRTVNTVLGTLCALSYASLPYKTLVTKHWLHHRYPMSAKDPDFCSLKSANFLVWYLHFMRQYWGWKQFIQLASAVGIVGFVLQLSPVNLVLFWAIPLLLSSLQLFYFGTYWPHQNVVDCHQCARSFPLPWLLSLLACYHFGYHQEHHEHPDIPWWGLPALYEAQH